MRLLPALLSLAAMAQPLGAQESRITARLMADHIGVLAHDSMRGRATPGREIELAADYIESHLRRARLRPAGEAGTYRQRFPMGRDSAAAGPGGPNVIAMLQGRDPALRGQYIAVVAHFDHVGVGRPVDGDSIRNGADDNASGTAGLLAIAEAFAGMSTAPRRSILFIAVSGEERGLLGSRWFVGRPTVPLDSIAALVNLDMISRNRPDSVYLNGWGKSTISDLVVRIARERRDLGLGAGPDEEDRAVTPADSDHYPFQRYGIPYIFFYTGPHPDYHRPGDHADRVDADKAARIAKLAFLTMLEMANADARPEWEPEARRRNVAAP